MIYKSISFKLAFLGIISLIIPYLAVLFRGLIGFIIIILLAIYFSFIEKSFSNISNKILYGIKNNKKICVLYLWYFIGVIANSFIDGRGFNDWRLFLSDFVFIIGLFFTFAFLGNIETFRYFKIVMIISIGIQSIFTSQQLLTNPDIARKMFLELDGMWMYGNQNYYSLYTVLLPVLISVSFQEKGPLRFILFLANGLTLFSVLISSFGTPFGLLIIAVVTTMVFSLFFLKNKKKFIYGYLILFFIFFFYQNTKENKFFISPYSRIENFINDPASGGYSYSEISVSRWYKNKISLSSFLNDPFFGSGGNIRYSTSVGGHSSLFDLLGAYGILGGGGAFLMIVLSILFSSLKKLYIERSWEALAILICVIMFISAGIINPYWEGNQPIFVIIFSRYIKL